MAKKKAKKPHLGRGLEALLGPQTTAKQEPAKLSDPKAVSEYPQDSNLRDAVRTVRIRDVNPNPYQPRTVWKVDELKDLAESIKANGIIQPILLRDMEDGTYEVIAGERRLRAAEIAGLEEVPVLVRQANDEEMLELALVENIHRSDLNPVERALAYQNYISTFDINQTQAAERLGENRSVVANHLRLLDLPQDIKKMLVDGELSMGHARALLALPDDDLRRKLANRALAGRLSVRDVERLVRMHLEGPKEEKKPKEKPSHIMDLERQLRESLGTKVTINAQKSGRKGKIIIEFYSLDEFDRLSERMGMVNADTRTS